MLLQILSFVSFAGGMLASPLANQYFENLIHTSLQEEIGIYSLDPLSFNNFTLSFRDKVGNFQVNGQANYTRGILKGIAQIRRYSECFGPYYQQGLVNFNCSLSFYNLRVTHNAKLKFTNMPLVYYNAGATIKDALIYVQLASSSMGRPSVKQLRLTSIGKITADPFHGLGATLNKYRVTLQSSYVNKIKMELYGVIEKQFRKAFERAAFQKPLPR